MVFKLDKFVFTNPLLRLIKLSNHNRDKQFIKELCKSCSKNDSVIYYLSIDENICGLIGVSVNKVDSIPCLQIDYIYVKEEYRKNEFEELGNKRISEFLLFFCIETAKEIQTKIGLRWLALIADNSELEKFYINYFQFTKYKTKNNIPLLFIAL